MNCNMINMKKHVCRQVRSNSNSLSTSAYVLLGIRLKSSLKIVFCGAKEMSLAIIDTTNEIKKETCPIKVQFFQGLAIPSLLVYERKPDKTDIMNANKTFPSLYFPSCVILYSRRRRHTTPLRREKAQPIKHHRTTASS